MLISAPSLLLGMIESVPVVPEEVMTSSGVCSSRASIQPSMSSQPSRPGAEVVAR